MDGEATREVEPDISTREHCWRWGTRLSRRTVAFGGPRDPGAASPATGRHAEREVGRVGWVGSWNECSQESLDPALPRPTSSPPPPALCSVGAGPLQGKGTAGFATQVKSRTMGWGLMENEEAWQQGVHLSPGDWPSVQLRGEVPGMWRSRRGWQRVF